MSYDDYNENHNFTFRFDSNDGERHLEMNCNELYLGDIFARFKEFLQGCGYEIHGDIEVVEYNSQENKLMRNVPIEPPYNYNEYDGYRLTEPPEHEPTYQAKFDFSNIPNNNWLFGTEQIRALTTADFASLTVTDLSTMTSKSYSDWTNINQYPTMAPLTTEQIESFSFKTEMPGTLGSAKVKF
jgi:hypothetical protein